MKVRLVDSLEGMEKLERSWNSLNPDTVFQTYEWNYSFLSVFKDQPYILVAEEKKKIVAVAPLMLVDSYFGKTVKFIGTPRSDYGDFVGSKKGYKRFMEFLDKRDDWHALVLDEMKPETCNRFSRVMDRRSFRYQTNICYRFDLSKDITKYLTKRSIRRHIKYLKNNGGLFCERVGDELDTYLKMLYKQHKKIWKHGTKAVFCIHCDYTEKILDNIKAFRF